MSAILLAKSKHIQEMVGGTLRTNLGRSNARVARASLPSEPPLREVDEEGRKNRIHEGHRAKQQGAYPHSSDSRCSGDAPAHRIME